MKVILLKLLLSSKVLLLLPLHLLCLCVCMCVCSCVCVYKISGGILVKLKQAIELNSGKT